jgi:hypothetical protein
MMSAKAWVVGGISPVPPTLRGGVHDWPVVNVLGTEVGTPATLILATTYTVPVALVKVTL